MIRKLLAGCSTALVSFFVISGVAGASFGFASVGFSATEEPTAEQFERGELGARDVQAGSHPYELTTSFVFNTTTDASGSLIPDGDVKDLLVELPPGLVGDVNVLPQCSIKQFETQFPELHLPGTNYGFSGASCPASTQVGFTDLRLRTGSAGGALNDVYVDAYNLVPPPGAPAQFGISPQRIPVLFRPSVRTRSDYGLTITASNIPQLLKIGGNTVTFWGVPGDPSHDALRGECLGAHGTIPHTVEGAPHQCATDSRPQPFLTLPTSCTGPIQATFRADSWQHPGRRNPDGTPDLTDPSWVSAGSQLPPMNGCDRPSFGPSLTAAPDTSDADSPAGLTAEVIAPQDGLLSAKGIAPANILSTTVTLPVGMAINPGQAAGLQACQTYQDGIGSEFPANCPAASKVGTVEIESPLLRDPLKGNVYVRQSDPPNLELLIVAAADGVEVKLPAQVHLDEATGQVRTTVANTPQLPFTDFKLVFSGGAQAALTTPPACGLYTTASDFTPWSAPLSGDVLATNSFRIDSGPGGSACASPLPFNPVMTAGGTTDQAGGFTNFSLLLQRGDGQQRISGLRFRTPPGLSGMISRVPLCGEPQAAQGKCSAASQIGHTVVTAGPGPFPLVVPEPGQPAAPIYLTGSYKGAPYGLSIAVPVIAGPFNLGTVVVRSAIAVDPHTAQLTISTDPLPSIIAGIPTDLRSINAVVDRPGFMFNPTNCNPTSFSGTATSTEGASAPISTHFQVGSCRSLAFKPDFKVSTSGKTSRKNGASLNVTIAYPKIVPGANQASSQSNVASVKVDLPKQLPSRLTTLQKACTAATFEANPASCPAGSLVGHARVLTPVLPVPLTGPAYFVSHGGEAFPSLIIVLQGYGIRVDLIGTTFISPAGITSSTFKTVPDVPFTDFALTLPQGRFSALTANGNLCRSKLAMPTAFTGQNGAVIHQSTKVTVTGCPKTKQTSRTAKQAHKHTNGKGKK